jgi:hypothetical protein
VQSVTLDEMKQAAAEAALEYVRPGTIVGVGTGSTAAFFVAALARRRDEIEAAVVPVPTPRTAPGRRYSSAADAAACFISSVVMISTYPLPGVSTGRRQRENSSWQAGERGGVG